MKPQLVVLALSLTAALANAAENTITDLTELARQFPRHQGATILYVNFDGWKDYDGKSHDILPYAGRDGLRGQNIQLVLFRTAEIFAPFDVEVRRLRGDAKRDRRPRGNTTIFVGANTTHIDKKGKKYTYASTDYKFSDYPGKTKGDAHRPNSDPFDIGFVDPVAQQKDTTGWQTTHSPTTIARSIAHEAGHTFGLTHVNSSPAPEIMSYDTSNVCFTNRTFRITDKNNTGTSMVNSPDLQFPSWKNTRIVSQNSFTYLRAALGARASDDHASVADPNAVGPAFQDGPLVELQSGQAQAGIIDRRGDYDVFLLPTGPAGPVELTVRPAGGSGLVPVLFVLNSDGRSVRGFANAKADSRGIASVTFETVADEAYKVVVGAADCATGGAYELTVLRAGTSTVKANDD